MFFSEASSDILFLCHNINIYLGLKLLQHSREPCLACVRSPVLTFPGRSACHDPDIGVHAAQRYCIGTLCASGCCQFDNFERTIDR